MLTWTLQLITQPAVSDPTVVQFGAGVPAAAVTGPVGVTPAGSVTMKPLLPGDVTPKTLDLQQASMQAACQRACFSDSCLTLKPVRKPHGICSSECAS
jgi:hypothetical protein